MRYRTPSRKSLEEELDQKAAPVITDPTWSATLARIQREIEEFHGQRELARKIAADCKPQMDYFLEAIGTAFDIPDEAEQQAAECESYEWLKDDADWSESSDEYKNSQPYHNDIYPYV